jgi:hypothetical protein
MRSYSRVERLPPVDCLWSYGVFPLLCLWQICLSLLKDNIIVRVYIIYCDIGYSVSIFYTVCVETCSWAHILVSARGRYEKHCGAWHRVGAVTYTRCCWPIPGPWMAIGLRVKLAAVLDVQWCQWWVQEAQPNPLFHLEQEISMPAIVEHLIMMLCLLQPIPHFRKELILIHHLVVNYQQSGLSQRVGAHRWWVTTIYHFEGDILRED